MATKPNMGGVEKRPRPQSGPEAPNPKKRKRYEEKPQRATRRTERRHLLADAKTAWEQLRPKATTKEKATKLVDELLDLLSNRIVEFVFRHDGSRIVQWMLTEGTEGQKKTVMNQLMNYSQHNAIETDTPFFVRLACDRYGHHLAFKMLRVSDKPNKALIFERYLRGNTSLLIKNSHGADVLDFAYQTMLNARQRSELVIELLYSRERKLLESIRRKLFQPGTTGKPGVRRNVFSDSLTLIDDNFRDAVVESAATTLRRMMDKESLLQFEIVHAAMKEYLVSVMASYPKEKTIEMAVELAPLLVHLTHTKAGIFVGINCVKVLDAKHRKKVVRGLKGHIRKILENEYGHRLILALFEWVDDTRLVGKTVASEMLSKCNLDKVLTEVDEGHKTKRGGRTKAEKKNKVKSGDKEDAWGTEKGKNQALDLTYVKDMCMHKYGRMVFLNLFCGRDTRYLNPDVYGVIWEDVDEEKFGQTSKKDGNVRRRELRGMFEHAVSTVMEREMRVLLQSHWCSGIVVGAAQVSETQEGVIRGLTTSLRHEESLREVLGSKCARKTIGALLKVGDRELLAKLVKECGIDQVEKICGKHERLAQLLSS